MVDRTEVDQMAKFMAAMQLGSIGAEADEIMESTSVQPPSVSGVNASAVAEMKMVLERFNAAANQVVTDATSDRELREALLTEATPKGAKIGAWEIRVTELGRHKLYDVISVNGELLAVDLLLYEAAHGLVRILNNGGRVNSREAIDLLRAEQDYNSRVQDMVLYKHRMVTNPASPRRAVYEARYSDARLRAAQARNRVTQLSEGR